MYRIMLNWTLLLIGLVFSAGAYHNREHRHHHANRDTYETVAEEVIYETPDGNQPGTQIITACNVTGVWYNSLGSELIINVTETGLVSGEFRTAVEREEGAAGNGPGRVSGWTSTDGSHKSIGFTVLWSNGASVTAWTGLCHVCQGIEIMKTTWILTSEVDTCDEHWSSNRIGQDDFTRFEQAPGPRRHLNIHTPSEAAEEIREGILTQEQQGI